MTTSGFGLWALGLLALLAQAAPTAPRAPAPTRVQVADGVYLFKTAPYGDVPAVNAAFKTQLVDWYLHRVYDELAGPLSDAIAAIPGQ